MHLQHKQIGLASKNRTQSITTFLGEVVTEQDVDITSEYFKNPKYTIAFTSQDGSQQKVQMESIASSVMKSRLKKIILIVFIAIFFSIYSVFLILEPDPSVEFPSSLSVQDFCQDVSTKTMLVIAFILIWLQNVLSDRLILPLVYRNHDQLSASKRKKTICYFVKSVLRCAFLFDCFYMHEFITLDHIIFGCSPDLEDNTRAFGQLVTVGLALVMWELSYVPELSWDMWAHHLIICFVIVLATEPSLDIYKDKYYPKFVYILAFGAAWAVVSEFCMLIYHETPRDNTWQQFWLIALITAVKFIVFTLFFLVWTTIFFVKYFKEMNTQAQIVAMIVNIGNIFVEGYMLKTAVYICKHKYTKYLESKAGLNAKLLGIQHGVNC